MPSASGLATLNGPAEATPVIAVNANAPQSMLKLVDVKETFISRTP